MLGISQACAQAATEDEGGHIVTVDHRVSHISTMPANDGDSVELFVRERYVDNRKRGKTVVMIHGRSVPALAGFELKHEHYDWALQLAKAGFDVFIADLQGSGRSPRPRMDDPCNASNFSPDFQQRRLLVTNPLQDGECAASFPYRLVSSKSEWDKLDTVIDYVRKLRDVEKVAIVSWSARLARGGTLYRPASREGRKSFPVCAHLQPECDTRPRSGRVCTARKGGEQQTWHVHAS